MGFEAPKMPSPEEMAKIEKERALSEEEIKQKGIEEKVEQVGEEEEKPKEDWEEKLEKEIVERRVREKEEFEKKMKEESPTERPKEEVELDETIRKFRGRHIKEEITPEKESRVQAKEKSLNIEDDKKYKKILERQALIYLNTEDKEWFEREFSGVAHSGYLLDKEGKETNLLPSQCITKGWEKVQREASWEFAARYPEEAEEYGIDMEEGSFEQMPTNEEETMPEIGQKLPAETQLERQEDTLVPEQALEEEKGVLRKFERLGGGKVKRIIASLMLCSALVLGAGVFEAHTAEKKQAAGVEQVEENKSFTVKDGVHEFKIVFRTSNVEELMNVQNIQFDKERGLFNLFKMPAGGGNIFSLEFPEVGGVRTQSVDVYGQKIPGAITANGERMENEIHIVINNSDHSTERIVIREGKVVSHTTLGR